MHNHAPDLLGEIGRSLASGKPLDLLADVSSLIAALEPKIDPFGSSGSNSQLVTLGELAQTFAEVDAPETSALLACLSQMAGDDLVRARARRALGQRAHPLPDWLRRLGETKVYRAVEMVEVLGDGDDLILGLKLPAGHELTLLVYVDHNMGTVVKDAFPVPDTIAGTLRMVRGKTDTEDISFGEISLADARVRIAQAIAVGHMTLPPLESETWPACRPLVEWALRLMPGGGTGYQRPDWTDEQVQAIAEDFFASSFGSPLDEFEHNRLLDSILEFGADYGPGDPMRWSPVSVEMLLIDWIPRTLAPNVKFLAKAPELVRAFVRYCHDARGIRPGLTADTLASVDRFEPEYQRLIRSPRLQGQDALLAAVGAFGTNDGAPFVPAVDEFTAEFAYGEEYMLGRLAEHVGGEAALDTLGDEPLPDEEFSWAGVPDDIRPAVAEVLQASDGFCDLELDTEYRTATRRLLARIATGDAAVFRRKSSPVISAASVCWLIGQANDLFGYYGKGMLVKDMMSRFGLRSSSVSQRKEVFLRAAGLDPRMYGSIRLGTPDLLVSSRRRTIIAARDRLRAALTDQ